MKTIKIIFKDKKIYYMLILENEPIHSFIKCLEKQINSKIDYYEVVM